MSTTQTTKGMSGGKLKVGVTLHLRDERQSIWENGIFQNVAFLVQLLALSPVVSEAVIVIDRDEPAQLSPSLASSLKGLKIITRPEAMETLDVLIEMSAQFSEEWVIEFRKRGGRYGWMRVGNDFVIDIERAMFDKPHAGLCSDKAYDVVWTLPEYERSCVDYFAMTTRAPVRIVPHLWTPQFFQQGIDSLPTGVTYGYQPGRDRWRLCSFEPNVCMVKTGVIPMLGCEEAYRARPRFLQHVRLCNTLHLKDQNAFAEVARTLDIVKHGLATFEGRFAVYEFMAHYGDAIISHQWENGQNYLYYEALYGGYPLIHNSEFIRDYGYYYPDFDCQLAGQAILKAFDEHDRNLDAYKASGRRLLHEVDVANPHNVEAYTQELLRLYA